jgi:hypothetical protein
MNEKTYTAKELAAKWNVTVAAVNYAIKKHRALLSNPQRVKGKNVINEQDAELLNKIRLEHRHAGRGGGKYTQHND